ncbi:MAG: hypothetical protein Q9187_007910 [Circinaria calcarea]
MPYSAENERSESFWRADNENLIQTRNRSRRDHLVDGQQGSRQTTGSMADNLANACKKGYSLTCLGSNRPESSTQSSVCGYQAESFREEFAVGRGGWWKRQMLVDRSLRLMAGLMTVFAAIMVLTCAVYFRTFLQRENRHSTSIGAKIGEQCDTVETRTTVLNLLINIAATMILGMSNTYQQLATSLKVDEIKWALSKRGDSRVGTNSPMAINDKRNGKLTSWLAWLLLISTSLPIHFLANSFIGPSLFIKPSRNVEYIPLPFLERRYSNYGYRDEYSDGRVYGFGCWTAFRTGKYQFSFEGSTGPDLQSLVTYPTIDVYYDSMNCTRYRNETKDLAAVEQEWMSYKHSFSHPLYGHCMGTGTYCKGKGTPSVACRTSVRMQAALILAGCLVVKAIYMITVNLKARRKVKSSCLTFGDVIVASSLDDRLRMRNECMVNAGDGYRHQTSHLCHKHCKDSKPSVSGDDLGHCQKCRRFNTIDKASNLEHPVIAIKFKKSLISNLGVTAVTQMIILMFASLAMIGSSLVLAVFIGIGVTEWKRDCREYGASWHGDCKLTRGAYLNLRYGGWGGFKSSATIGSLPINSLWSEQLSFVISNGPQLLFSMLYLLLVYNITLISMEHDWGKFERERQRLRCTLVTGKTFKQSYFLQLPKQIILPLMGLSSLMHWLLGQAISTRETVWSNADLRYSHSKYDIVYAVYPIWLSTVLMTGMTAICWWAFTYKREGFMPQMYGSIRACCAATTELDHFTEKGIQWGDLGAGERFRHAGFSSGTIREIEPAELYCGRESGKEKAS